MHFEIRKARRKDLPAIVDILAHMEDHTPPPVAAVTRIHREMRRHPSHTCYLAYADGELVGTFTLLIVPTLAHEQRLHAIVDTVVVARDRRGRGIGGAMMAEAMRLAAEAGCYRLAVSSDLAREDADRFYRSLGFRQHGVSFWIDIVPLGHGHKSVRELVGARD